MQIKGTIGDIDAPLADLTGNDTEANARLMAAAPQMLAALKQVVAICDSGHSQALRLAKDYAQTVLKGLEAS